MNPDEFKRARPATPPGPAERDGARMVLHGRPGAGRRRAGRQRLAAARARGRPARPLRALAGAVHHQGGGFLKQPAEWIAARTLGREVRVTGDFQFYFAPIDLRVRAEGLTVANPAWLKGPFFSARLIDSRLSTFRLLFGQRVIKQLVLDQSALDLQWSKDARFNSWTFGNPSAPPKPLTMPDIRTGSITGSRVHYSDPRLLLAADFDIASVAAANSRVAETIGFTGRGRMRGLPFALDGRLLTPNASLAGGENRLVVHARSGATRLDATGVLRQATQLEGARFPAQCARARHQPAVRFSRRRHARHADLCVHIGARLCRQGMALPQAQRSLRRERPGRDHDHLDA